MGATSDILGNKNKRREVGKVQNTAAETDEVISKTRKAKPTTAGRGGQDKDNVIYSKQAKFGRKRSSGC